MNTWYSKNKEKVLTKQAREKELFPEKSILCKARQRAKLQSLPFNINLEDIVIPKLCPLLGIEIKVSKGKLSNGSPSLDRLIPELGYVKGNVWVISHKANRMKNNSSLEELEQLVNNLRDIINGK